MAQEKDGRVCEAAERVTVRSSGRGAAPGREGEARIGCGARVPRDGAMGPDGESVCGLQ